ncbi:MAG: rotamase [Absicoccus sp.]|uniref:Rotamase n=1 Tax=Absicoccus intestinalis TaxID=2926319 RepID=A0ABU4WRR7_9FIRM|nr:MULTISPECIES: rotamase [unclassified Absicoccus]MDX8418210.1 rotamase [Absicoccus sp. CLA-KB-P134]MDY3035913.1 rotamase [Absicoccus sp.]
MGQFLRDNWFVVVIAIVIIGFVSYFIYDSNKYNVSSMKDGNSDVVMSVTGGNVTADEIYSDLSKDDGELLYNLYKNAVVSQTVKETDSIKNDAKTLQDNIVSYAKQQDSNNYEQVIEQELYAYGYSSYDDLNKYCLESVKEAKMNEDYVNDHFASLSKAVVAKNPRTISIITMSVSDASNLTSDEQKKKDNIDSALQKQSFAKTATAYSEDTTASDKGVYGYIDEDDKDSSSSSSLDSSVIEAALKLKKGETSDWITVTDSDAGTTTLYKVHVNETDVNTIHKSKNTTIKRQLLNAILNNNTGLSTKIVQTNAKKLKITIKDKNTKKKLNAYINEQLKGDASNE